jgi:predicted DNA-binding transcriptional regulator AlpA
MEGCVVSAAVLHHPPAYPSCKTLAAELDISESTVDSYVKQGILPPPIKVTKGCVRWDWEEVKMWIGAKRVDHQDNNDPFMRGVENVAA